MSDKIYIRGGLAADRPTLAEREPSLDTDTKQVWIGTSNGNMEIHTPYNKISSFAAFQAIAQSILAGTFTKALFQALTFDNKSEYNITNSRFTALEAGEYLFNATIYWASQSSGNLTEMLLYKNGTLAKYLYQNIAGGTGVIQMAGVGKLLLSAGDYVEIYVYSTNALDTTIGQTISYFDGIRIG